MSDTTTPADQPRQELTALETAVQAARAADAKKATSVAVLNVGQRLAITDYFVLASADNERHVNAVIDAIDEALLAEGIKPVRREGGKEGRWELLDYVDVVVHVQLEEVREFYGLDNLWKDCSSVDWASDTPTIQAPADGEAETETDDEADA